MLGEIQGSTDILRFAGHPAALSIAGFDPSSGAGVTADLKVFAAHGVYGLAAITALTVQSTQGVQSVEPVDAAILGQTLNCLAEDIEIAGIKIGMLATGEAVQTVAGFLAVSGIPAGRIVVDPILRSSSGRELLSIDGVERLKKDLLPLAGWVAPNTEELAILTGVSVIDPGGVPGGAARLAQNYPGLNVVVTGGHLERPDDFLRIADGTTRWFMGNRIDTEATHGTGCAFSSALLARLVAGDGAQEAVLAAKEYVAEGIRRAYPIGKGRGPMHHLFRLG